MFSVYSVLNFFLCLLLVNYFQWFYYISFVEYYLWLFYYFSGSFKLYRIHLQCITVSFQIVYHFMCIIRTLQQYASISTSHPGLCGYCYMFYFCMLLTLQCIIEFCFKLSIILKKFNKKKCLLYLPVYLPFSVLLILLFR